MKQHVWFKEYEWDKLLQREIQSPYVPREDEITWIANENRKDSGNEIDQESLLSLRRNSIQGKGSREPSPIHRLQLWRRCDEIKRFEHKHNGRGGFSRKELIVLIFCSI